MGKTLTGSQGTIDLMSPEQMQYLRQAFSGQGPYGQYLQPQSQEDLMAAFQTGVVEPSLQQYQQQVLPSIQQRFVDANAGSSSALNQALAQSAENLQTNLASQYIPFMQGQQQNQLSALGQLGNLAGLSTFQPYQQQGILGSIIGSLGQIGGGVLPWWLNRPKVQAGETS